MTDQYLAEFAEFGGNDMDKRGWAAKSIARGTARRDVARLSDAIAAIDGTVQQQVCDNYEQLLDVAVMLNDQRGAILHVDAGVGQLVSSVERVKAELEAPYTKIKMRYTQVCRMHDAAELLQRVSRFVHLARKLNEALQSASPDLAKAAHCWAEINSLLKDSDLSGITVVDRELMWFSKVGDMLTGTASKLLSTGLENQNHTEIICALHVFYHMSTLADKVNSAISSILEKVSLSLSNTIALDKTFSSDLRASMSDMMTRGSLWTRFGQSVEVMYTSCCQAWCLYSLLGRTLDPSSRSTLLDNIQGAKIEVLLKTFWKNFCKILSDKFIDVTYNRGFIEATFIADYPKLVKLFYDFLSRLKREPSIIFDSEQDKALYACFSTLETAYLKNINARLTEHMNTYFQSLATNKGSYGASAVTQQSSSNTPIHNPTTTVLQTFVRTMVSELEAVQGVGDCTIGISVVQAVIVVLKLYMVKTKDLINTDPEAYQIRSPMNPTQVLNASQFQSLVHVHSSLLPLVDSSSFLLPAAKQILSIALQSIDTLADQCVARLFANQSRQLETFFLQMHNEDFSGAARTEDCSEYVGAVERQMSHFKVHYLNRYMPSATISSSSSSGNMCPQMASHLKSLASRTITSFIRSVSLIRPFGSRGRVRLPLDMAQLELCFGSITPLKTAGDVYKQLVALRQLVQRDITEFESSKECNSLPPSIVLHHLLFRTSQDVIPSPHVFHRMTLQQYFDWLEKHSEEEIWTAMLKPCLDSYAESVNQKGEKAFAGVYPIIMQLAPRLIAQWKAQSQDTRFP
ncbi:Conserved oligomeric Golgi complex subunit 5 [Pelomyxa schiedti]|nr:Conserved oligomeric Golgi complex subunit 5 [Pelomyxa schiedti]